ncbi:SLOG family protein [Streptomyces sp. NPDC051287]|uniref:SLOG family protein n=1 Tax=Streptomyces sp. NPDC051287 TaxID=3365648 RepID=UPI00378A049C
MTVTMELSDARVLVCGDRRWCWPDTVTAVLDRLVARRGDRLVVIEGAATGADRHRCHPVDWQAERHARPKTWRLAGPERNTRMLAERPSLVVAFHSRFDPGSGGTSDMCLRGLLSGVPAWLVPGREPDAGRWLLLEEFPEWRTKRVRRELAEAPPGGPPPPPVRQRCQADRLEDGGRFRAVGTWDEFLVRCFVSGSGYLVAARLLGEV